MTLTITIENPDGRTCLRLKGSSVPELLQRMRGYIRALKLEHGQAVARLRARDIYS